MSKKLIIWDFDGVISDTEYLWIKNWMMLINRHFKLSWDFDKTNEVLGGIAPKTKIERLANIGINIDNHFLDELKILDNRVIDCGLSLIEGVEDIFKLDVFEHCIATGGRLEKTMRKIRALELERYFKDDVIFSADLVDKGKPEPELFLFAAEKMGVQPRDCIVLEDSLAGLSAGLKAGMMTIAFVGCEMNNNEEYKKKVSDLGVKYLFDNMRELREFLLSVKK